MTDTPSPNSQAAQLMTPSDSVPSDKIKALQDNIRQHGKVAVAFSAGVDSTLLLKVAIDALGADNVLAVTGKSKMVPDEEFDSACGITRELGVEHLTMDTHELDSPAMVANPEDRCYICRCLLYEQILPVLKERGFDVLINGANKDDASDYRPGHRAADEHGVRSPLAETGWTKAEIRAYSQQLGLPTFNKPAMPCLATRIPYHDEITVEKCCMIERAESYLRKEIGLWDCRVRHHDRLARIEVSEKDIETITTSPTREKIIEQFKQIGYLWVAVDLKGFKSGSMNEGLPQAT